jgi:hypothetical protein
VRNRSNNEVEFKAFYDSPEGLRAAMPFTIRSDVLIGVGKVMVLDMAKVMNRAGPKRTHYTF